MSECDNNCSGCSQADSCAQAGSKPTTLDRIEGINKIVGIVSGKGGVGKSFVTSALSVMMSNKGYRCAILDADITGPSIPQMFGIHKRAKAGRNGLLPVETDKGIEVMSLNLLMENETDPVVWRGPIITGAVKQFYTDVAWSERDFLFLDMPPGTADVPLTVFQSIPIDAIIIVTSPQDLVSMVVSKAVKMAQMMNVKVLGLIENYSFVKCPKCGEKINIFKSSDNKVLADSFNLKLMGEIPLSADYAQACDNGSVEKLNIKELDGAVSVLEEFAKNS